LGVFFARVVRAGQPAKGARWAMQSIGNTAAGIAAALNALAKPKIHQQRGIF
jgi:hypothetical protein